MIYGMSYPVFNFFAYSIDRKKVVYSQFMQSITHIAAVDDDGGYWGTWGYGHHLFRYDPKDNAVKFFDHGLPSKCESLMYPHAGPIDSMINGGDGYLYIGSEKCELYRLDPKTAEVTYLAKPFVSNRMPGLLVGSDGLIYGAGGNDDNVRIFSYDRGTGAASRPRPCRRQRFGRTVLQAARPPAGRPVALPRRDRQSQAQRLPVGMQAGLTRQGAWNDKGRDFSRPLLLALLSAPHYPASVTAGWRKRCCRSCWLDRRV